MKVGKLASAVYSIVVNNPNSTIGEVFEVYKQTYPTTTRSRNEIAKRVSELRADGLLAERGSRKCDCSGRSAMVLVANRAVGVEFSSDLPEETVQETAKDFDSREEMAEHITSQYGEKCVAMDEEDRKILRQLRQAADMLVGNPLFEVFASEKLSLNAQKVFKALRHF
jgi:hypothetical protein